MAVRASPARAHRAGHLLPRRHRRPRNTHPVQVAELHERSVTGALGVGATEMPSLAQLPAWSPARAAVSESFWRQVRALYAPDPGVIDFDNGNSGASPTAVIEAYVRRARLLCAAPNGSWLRRSV